MSTVPGSDHPEWPQALATVLRCKYAFGAGRALAFGIPRTRQFQITYNYFADGELHSGEFYAAKPIPQGTLFPIRYNPEAPHDHKHEQEPAKLPSSRRATIIVGMIGSVILSLAWLLVLRACY